MKACLAGVLSLFAVVACSKSDDKASTPAPSAAKPVAPAPAVAMPAPAPTPAPAASPVAVPPAAMGIQFADGALKSTGLPAINEKGDVLAFAEGADGGRGDPYGQMVWIGGSGKETKTLPLATPGQSDGYVPFDENPGAIKELTVNLAAVEGVLKTGTWRSMTGGKNPWNGSELPRKQALGAWTFELATDKPTLTLHKDGAEVAKAVLAGVAYQAAKKNASPDKCETTDYYLASTWVDEASKTLAVEVATRSGGHNCTEAPSQWATIKLP